MDSGFVWGTLPLGIAGSGSKVASSYNSFCRKEVASDFSSAPTYTGMQQIAACPYVIGRKVWQTSGWNRNNDTCTVRRWAKEYVGCMPEFARVVYRYRQKQGDKAREREGEGGGERERERVSEASAVSDWLSATSSACVHEFDCTHSAREHHEHPQIFLTDLRLGMRFRLEGGHGYRSEV